MKHHSIDEALILLPTQPTGAIQGHVSTDVRGLQQRESLLWKCTDRGISLRRIGPYTTVD